jgi:dienelactone hydrolase
MFTRVTLEMPALFQRTSLGILLGLLAACGNASKSPAAPSPNNPLAGFALTGDPTGANGATWTYRTTSGSTSWDLQGILFKPAGNGPFPAVIVSHGAGGNANGYSRSIARTMVAWGLVVIATNYTHAGGVPVGSPGTAAEPGASTANVARARQLVEILRGLGYVDTNRLALHGHSMGAFVTSGVLSAHPDVFRAASHTAGGSRPDTVSGAAPTDSQVAAIRTPYQLHHGDNDMVVPLASDQRLASVLAGRSVIHELHVYAGADHDDVSQNAMVLDRVRAWFAATGIF